jgi:hypothetical protein
MNFHPSARSANMATLTRTIRPLLIAAAALALMAPAAQAKPLETPAGPLHAAVGGHAAHAASGASFGWTEIVVGLLFVAIVAAIGILGARTSHRRTATA